MLKLITVGGEDPDLSKSDPLIRILSQTQVMLLVAGAEVMILTVLLRRGAVAIKLYLVALISSLFLMYKLGLFMTGYEGTCNCVGDVWKWVGVNPVVVDHGTTVLSLLMLLGSVAARQRLVKLSDESSVQPGTVV